MIEIEKYGAASNETRSTRVTAAETSTAESLDQAPLAGRTLLLREDHLILENTK